MLKVMLPKTGPLPDFLIVSVCISCVAPQAVGTMSTGAFGNADCIGDILELGINDAQVELIENMETNDKALYSDFTDANLWVPI